ncbi:MAG TPA: response regulator [Gemmatimonadales bacterium]|nr:response regulator [Gemmatimonadales bacterium]
MSNPTARPRPLVVLASRETGELQALETALYSAGYRVVTARNEHETLQKVRTHLPDAVVLDRELSDRGYTFCRELRADPAISPATAIILTQDTAPTYPDRLEALRAGAWDIQGLPPDPQELMLRLSVYLEAKLEVDRLTAECLIDRGSGLYNAQGFEQRADELAALTSRQGNPAACAVFRPADDLATRATGDRLGRAFKSIGRLSDAIGRTAYTEFAIFAPATNDWAASRMVRRVRDHVVQEVGYVAEYGRRITLRASYSATLPSQKVEPRLLLERARSALETPS